MSLTGFLLAGLRGPMISTSSDLTRRSKDRTVPFMVNCWGWVIHESASMAEMGVWADLLHLAFTLSLADSVGSSLDSSFRHGAAHLS